MKYGLLIGGALFLLVIIFGLGAFFGYMGFSNTSAQYESQIGAQWEQMKNVYDNGWKQVMEENQMSDKYADQFKNAFQAIMRGDSNGQQAMINVLTAIPNFDSGVIKKVQESIEVFHSSFQGSQTQLIAAKQSYRNYLTATTSGRLWNMIGNYPKIRCGIPLGAADDYAIITSDKTDTDFKNHKSGVLQLK